MKNRRLFVNTETKYRRLKKWFIGYSMVTLLLLCLAGFFLYQNYDYFVLKYMISKHYLYTETLDTVFEEELNVNPEQNYYKYFDKLAAKLVTEKIKETGGDRYTYLYLEGQYEKSKEASEIKAAQSEFEELSSQTGYIKLTNFSKKSEEYLKSQADILGKYPYLIIDLRNNTGGSINSMYRMEDLFLEKGSILAYENTRSRFFSKTVKAKKKQSLTFDGIVILQNKSTASASEGFICALKENLDNVVIIGETSFGKGIGQFTMPLKSEYALKATVLEWLSPEGNSIQGSGISPDIAYEDEDIISYAQQYLESLNPLLPKQNQ